MGDRFAVRSQGAPGDDGTINWGIFKRHFRGELLRHQQYVRDDKPFAGQAPPAAVFFYSRDRTAEHPERHLRDSTLPFRHISN